jgi:hypothetical protein
MLVVGDLMDVEKTDFNYCPECGERIEENAVMCNSCGSWFDVENETQVSNVQPIYELVVLLILTGSLYQLYWFYRNWRDFKAYKNLDIYVGLRTLGLFIPLVNLYLIGTQFRDMRNYEVEAGIKPFSLYGVIILWVVLSVLSVRLSFYANPFTGVASLILAFCLVIPFYMVQKSLNEYWMKEQDDLPLRKGISGGEILVLIVGLILLGLELLGIVALFVLI